MSFFFFIPSTTSTPPPEPPVTTDIPLWALAGLILGAISNIDIGTVFQTLIPDIRPLPVVRLTEGNESGEIVLEMPADVVLTGSEPVSFLMRLVDGTEPEIEADGEVEYRGSSARAALVKFSFSEDTPVPAAGDYDAQFVVDGQSMPPGRFIRVIVGASLAA